MNEMILLGTGTSDGIPRLGCDCPVCTSQNPADRRLRTSACINTEYGTAVIDTGLDFRQQALANGVKSLDAVLFTHCHADHVEGITELRPLSLAHKKMISCYGLEDTLASIEKRFSYIFSERREGGGLPLIKLQPVQGPFRVFEKEVVPLPVDHGSEEITGYRFGDLAYITDASHIPESTLEKMAGINTLVINALRHKPHSTHFSIDEAVEFAGRTDAATVRLIHLSHKVSHNKLLDQLPEGIRPGVDGERLTFRW